MSMSELNFSLNFTISKHHHCTNPIRKQIKFYSNMNFIERNDSKYVIFGSECFSCDVNGA